MVGSGDDTFTAVVREPRLERAAIKSGLVIIWSSIKSHPTFIFLNNHNPDLHRLIEKSPPAIRKHTVTSSAAHGTEPPRL